MRKQDGFWIDEETSNKWDCQAFTEETAEKLSGTLISCYGCEDCGFCFNCYWCNNCWYCINLCDQTNKGAIRQDEKLGEV